MSHIDIVFDGPPGPEAGRFVEIENQDGESIKFGEWVERDDGYWALRIHSEHENECERLGRHVCGPTPELFPGTRDALKGISAV